MPRYCAAICCKNRRGRNDKDRKLSFYPFPLHDKERLEKWLKNMKRDSWVPSKYQFLCSDHFTPDSLDIRWGIRYLKQTAIPTIFSVPEDCQGKDTSKKKSQKRKVGDDTEVCLKAKSEESFASGETKENTESINVLPEHAELLAVSALGKPSAPKAESLQNDILTLKQDTLETSINQDLNVFGFCTNSENLNSTTLTASNGEDIITNHLPNPNFTSKSMETMSRQGNQFFFSTIEELNTNKESAIAIFIPTENYKPAVNSFIPAPKETREMEYTDIEDSLYKEVDHGAEVLQIEHSYCRQDMNKEHLWQKVSNLHSKITLLELQEQQTLGRLKSLEALISQLKQENWLSKENVKIIENHFTTYQVTMI